MVSQVHSLLRLDKCLPYARPALDGDVQDVVVDVAAKLITVDAGALLKPAKLDSVLRTDKLNSLGLSEGRTCFRGPRKMLGDHAQITKPCGGLSRLPIGYFLKPRREAAAKHADPSRS